MKYYAIVPVRGKDTVEGLWRERDDGIAETWNTQTKRWEITGAAWGYQSGQDISYRTASPEEVKEFTGE